MSSPHEAAEPQTRNVVHVLLAPTAPVVGDAVLLALAQADRSTWYPSLLIEDASDTAAARVAFEARTIGVPVTSPRRRVGNRVRDRARGFFDRWFYARDAHPSVLHIHRHRSVSIEAPMAWVVRVMSSIPVVDTEYWIEPSSAAGEANARTTLPGEAASIESTVAGLVDNEFLTGLYDAACAQPSASAAEARP